MTTNKRLPALGFLCLPFICGVAAAGEVRFDGDNRMLGEFKKLERGQLSFKTVATDTIQIDWDHVDSVSSSKFLEIELTSGQIFYGRIEHSNSSGQLEVHEAEGIKMLPLSDVIRMTEIEDSIRERFDGTVSAGMNLTKVNSYESYSFGLDMTYTTKKYVSSADGSYRLNRSDDSADAKESSLQIRSSRKWKNRNYTGGLIDLYSNAELGVDLRSSIGAAVGKDLVSTNSKIFHMEGGLLYTTEDESGSNNSTSSTEAFLGARFDLFRFDVPKLDLTAQVVGIPSLTESGRIRAKANVTMRWEMIKDLYWILNYSGNYDSDPPGQTVSNAHYNLYSGIAYDF